MKKIGSVCLAIALGCSLLLSGCSAGGSGMRQEMTAFDYAKEMGIGTNLGNTFDAYWQDLKNTTSGCSVIGENTPQNYETCWGAVETTQETIVGMKEAGFNTLRIPVYWGNMMQNDDKYNINPDYLARVEEIVGYSLEAGMYTVINIHHYDEYIIKHHDKERALEITAHLWKQIAEHFKDYSDYLVFEGFNENLGSTQEGDSYSEDELYDYVNEMNQVFVDTVRKTGGNNKERLLVVSGYWTNIDKTTDDRFLLPEDSAEDRLMVSVHYIDNAMIWSNQIGSKAWEHYSRQQCELLKARFIDQGIPVFVGECNAIYPAEHMAPNPLYLNSQSCLAVLLHMAVDYDLVPILWDVHNNMYSRTEHKIKDEMDQAVVQEIADRIASEE